MWQIESLPPPLSLPPLAEGGYKYPRSYPKAKPAFGKHIDKHGMGLSTIQSAKFVAEMMTMMVREETRSHFYFYYSYCTRHRRGSRSLSTGRKA